MYSAPFLRFTVTMRQRSKLQMRQRHCSPHCAGSLTNLPRRGESSARTSELLDKVRQLSPKTTCQTGLTAWLTIRCSRDRRLQRPPRVRDVCRAPGSRRSVMRSRMLDAAHYAAVTRPHNAAFASEHPYRP